MNSHVANAGSWWIFPGIFSSLLLFVGQLVG